jgi:hypothetical protein
MAGNGNSHRPPTDIDIAALLRELMANVARLG